TRYCLPPVSMTANMTNTPRFRPARAGTEKLPPRPPPRQSAGEPEGLSGPPSGGGGGGRISIQRLVVPSSNPSRKIRLPSQPSKRNARIRVAQLWLAGSGLSSPVNQKVQSSAGSTDIAE